MFSLVEAFLLLSYTGMVYVLYLSCVIVHRMVYVLSCRGFLVIVHRDGVCVFLGYRTQGWCMFSPVEAFLMLSYTGMVYVLSCRGFLVVIIHRDGVFSLL